MWYINVIDKNITSVSSPSTSSTSTSSSVDEEMSHHQRQDRKKGQVEKLVIN